MEDHNETSKVDEDGGYALYDCDTQYTMQSIDQVKLTEKPAEDSPVATENTAEEEDNTAAAASPTAEVTPSPRSLPPSSDKENNDEEELDLQQLAEKDPIALAQRSIIEKTKPTSELEIALTETLNRKDTHISRLTNEIFKLQRFISKRKQTYKRKRKDDGAPTRPLSGYNLFIKERFAQLAKENEEALVSQDPEAKMRRVPPAALVAKTGNEWKQLSPEVKAEYDARAKGDRKRYDEQMKQYKAPSHDQNRKRNKTGYNMFFSAHVLRLKQSDSGVPSERGSVARLVGTAWKTLTADEKNHYEREADKHNCVNPPMKDGEEEVVPEEEPHQQIEYHHSYPPEMHMPPPAMHMMHDQRSHPSHHHGYYPAPSHMYPPPPPPYGYDYSQHQRHQQARAQGYQQVYHAPPQHGYDRSL